jgi:hypothetical protein
MLSTRRLRSSARTILSAARNPIGWATVLCVAAVAVTGAAVALAAQDDSSNGSPSVPASHPIGGDVPSLRTATSRTYRMSDGSYRAEFWARPVNYRDAKGHWQPIDDTLQRTSDGALENAAGATDLSLPKDASGDVQLRAGDDLSSPRPPPSRWPSQVKLAGIADRTSAPLLLSHARRNSCSSPVRG